MRKMITETKAFVKGQVLVWWAWVTGCTTILQIVGPAERASQAGEKVKGFGEGLTRLSCPYLNVNGAEKVRQDEGGILKNSP